MPVKSYAIVYKERCLAASILSMETGSRHKTIKPKMVGKARNDSFNRLKNSLLQEVRAYGYTTPRSANISYQSSSSESSINSFERLEVIPILTVRDPCFVFALDVLAFGFAA